MLDRALQLPVAEITGLTFEEPRIIMLDNGVEMNVITDPTAADVCRVTVLMPGGRAEASVKAVAAMSAGQMRQGTATMDAVQISDRFDTAGAWLKESVSAHGRCLVLNSLTRNVRENTALLTDIMMNAAYPQGPLDTDAERRAARLEIESQKAAFCAAQMSNELIAGPDHPLTDHDTPAKIREVTSADLREFNSRFRTVSGMKVFVAGNVDEATLQAIAGEFAAIAPDPCHAEAPLREVPLRFGTPGVYAVATPQSVQAAVNISIPAVNRSHPDYIDLRHTIVALGGYFGSRLMANIREEKGYTYGINAALMGYREGGFARIVTECDPAYVQGVLDETANELRRLVTDPPHGDEMMRLKRSVRMVLASTIDNSFSRLDYVLDGICSGFKAADYFNAQVKAIDSLTPDRIAEIAQKYLTPSRAITVVAVENPSQTKYIFK